MRHRGTCAVRDCMGGATREYAANGGLWLLCDAHGSQAARAVEEVMSRLLATGFTYLPGTGSTVLVEYIIEPALEATFRAWRELDPAHPVGFVGETLFRAQWDGEDDEYLHFVNLGHWANPAAFYRHFDIQPGQRPGRKDFEGAQRRRAWLLRDT